jgi:hypothetical protein
VASEEWDADIISLSFGFPRRFRRIHQEIEDAMHRGKVVFAAASNDGGNTARIYPANQEGVICVHSMDGLSNASLFNPTALDNTDNFCVVGEHIEAAWPSHTTEELGGTKRLTGNSFATPVAVAIAAFMIGFVDQNAQDHADWVIPLKSPAAVRVFFRAISERRSGRYDSVNPVGAFGAGREADHQRLLANIRARLM